MQLEPNFIFMGEMKSTHTVLDGRGRKNNDISVSVCTRKDNVPKLADILCRFRPVFIELSLQSFNFTFFINYLLETAPPGTVFERHKTKPANFLFFSLLYNRLIITAVPGMAI